MLKPIAALFSVCVFLAAQTITPERRVEGNVITSARDPKVRIELPTSVKYIGADRWILYEIADCEVQVFVDSDTQKNVQRLYWVQFEGYIPSKPELKHTYDSPRHTNIGGLDFFVDTWVRQKDAPSRGGSDRQHVETLIRNHGYIMPEGMAYLRLVHLLDESKRKELMIIYGEDLAPTGFSAADLEQSGKSYDRWPQIEKDLIERAQQKIAIRPL